MDGERSEVGLDAVGVTGAGGVARIERTEDAVRLAEVLDRLADVIKALASAVVRVAEAFERCSLALDRIAERHAAASRLDLGEHPRLSVPSGTHAPRAGALPHGRTR